MKNLNKIVALLVLAVTVNSCSEDSDNTVNQVFDNVQSGAVLRTISVNNALLNGDVDTSEFSVTVEEQDAAEGGLLQDVQLWVRFVDKTPGNGLTDVPDGLVTTIPAGEWSTDTPFGLPRYTLTATVSEIKVALGISNSQITAGDVLLMRPYLNLTDGRTYNADNAGGIITGGFFASPFQYNALVTCSPEPGDYAVEMTDSYGDGWQTTTGGGGEGLTVYIDQTIAMVGLCSPYGSAAGSFLESGAGTGCTENDGYMGSGTITIPTGTNSASWEFPGDAYGEIGFEVYAPDGSLLYSAGAGETGPGLLPITFCKQTD